MDKQQKLDMMKRDYEASVQQLRNRTTGGNSLSKDSQTVGGFAPLSHEHFNTVGNRKEDTQQDHFPNTNVTNPTLGGYSNDVPMHQILTQDRTVAGEIQRLYRSGEDIESIADSVSQHIRKAVSGLDVYKTIKAMNLD